MLIRGPIIYPDLGQSNIHLVPQTESTDLYVGTLVHALMHTMVSAPSSTNQGTQAISFNSMTT